MNDIAGNQGELPQELVLTGDYAETTASGEEAHGSCSYTVCFAGSGVCRGWGTDQHGGVAIEGKLDLITGDIVWKERTGGGDATSVLQGTVALEGDKLALDIFYNSDYLGTKGKMQLFGQIAASKINQRKSLWRDGDARSPHVPQDSLVVGFPMQGSAARRRPNSDGLDAWTH